MEWIVAGLSCSFILSSGVVKDVGSLFLRWGVPEMWMPAAVGALFLAPFSAGGLDARARARAKRGGPRRARSEGPDDCGGAPAIPPRVVAGVVPIDLLYLLLSAFREYRDNFGIEIFQQLGLGRELGLFTRTEDAVALGVLAVMLSLSFVRDHRRALLVMFGLMAAGLGIVGGATLLQWRGQLGAWRGDADRVRLVSGICAVWRPALRPARAAARVGGNALFAIYFVDSIAYLGVVAVQLEHDLFSPTVTRLDFLRTGSLVLAGVGIALLAVAGWRMWKGLGPVTKSHLPT
jgi:hypothetical protein